MAYEFYVTIEGTKQGKFKGESSRDAHKDKIEGLAFEWKVQSPRDIATGQASGKRQHLPIKITKEWGAASPQILQALCSNEVMKNILFEFIRTTPEGAEEIHHTIKLLNATISEVHPFIEMTKHEERTDVHELEEVSFTYQRVEVENKTGKTMAVDDWTK
ncbi:MAG: type VI secretion system tube protein Hcp [Acidobacteriia bacterium]|nr:type VI secretion system tube protein Hcp [Terriglobia bacterium]